MRDERGEDPEPRFLVQRAIEAVERESSGVIGLELAAARRRSC
jgi:hypothetical protein